MSETPSAPSSPLGATAILEWLELPAHEDLGQELGTLKGHLLTLDSIGASSPQFPAIREQIYGRTLDAIGRLTPDLINAAPPLRRKLRAQLKATQELAERLARIFLAEAEGNPPDQLPAACLWRAQHLLQQHLLISALAASPPAVGIWELAHRTYSQALEQGIEQHQTGDAPTRIEDEYGSTLLLACAQPASFSAPQLAFVADICRRHGHRLQFLTATDDNHPSLFWIDPQRDSGAIALNRRLPPPDTPLRWFSCDALATHLRRQLQSLEAGVSAATLELPEFAATMTGRSILRRLIAFWGHPAKRRFPRRRQSYRVDLHTGLEALTTLLREPTLEGEEGSTWMITNESPDGYALMHLSGKAGKLEVGDVVALKPENQPPGRHGWQACIIRWALSENPEHLEIGLQVLAPQALPATLGLPGDNAKALSHVLLLPAVPGLRPDDAVVVPTGTLSPHQDDMVLLIEKDNLEIREIKATHLDEQTARVEIFAIAPQEPANADL